MVAFGWIIKTQLIRRTQLDLVIQDYKMLVENSAGIKSPSCPIMKGIFKMGFNRKIL